MKVKCDELFYCGYVKEAEAERDSLKQDVQRLEAILTQMETNRYKELCESAKVKKLQAQLDRLVEAVGLFAKHIPPETEINFTAIKFWFDLKAVLSEIRGK